MSSNQNQQILTGNLVRDPEFTPTESAEHVFVSMRVASHDEYVSGSKREVVKHTEYFNVEFACTPAQRAYYERNFRTGALVFVSGKTRTRPWMDSNQQKHYLTAVKTSPAQVELLKAPQDQPERNRPSDEREIGASTGGVKPTSERPQRPAGSPVEAPAAVSRRDLMDFDQPSR